MKYNCRSRFTIFRLTWLIRNGLAVVGLAILAVCASSALAFGQFSITSPPQGATFSAGQPVTIQWTGGDPDWTVNIQLIDYNYYQVVKGLGTGPNSGSRTWTFPSDLTCGHVIGFYIENVQRTSWTYGPNYTFVCPPTVNVADGDVAGLISAIRTANTVCQANVINLAPNGNYTLTSVAEDPNDWGSPVPTGLPYIRGRVMINGNGATIQRSNAPGIPLFTILGVSRGGGPCPDDNGDLTLNEVTLTGGNGVAGAVASAVGKVLIQNSTITRNIGSGGGGCCAVPVGGILSFGSTLTILNSTVSYNSGDSGYGGGGILLFGGGTASVSFSTFYDNTNPGWGRGNAIGSNTPDGQVTIKNSILASPSHPDENVCNAGVLTSLGHNLGGDASCTPALTGPGDIKNTDPLLSSLANWGGPTPTLLPQGNSPVIDAVPLSYCTDAFGASVARDQRGASRPSGAACDIGSVDVPGDQTPPAITPSVSGTVGNNGWYRSAVSVSWAVTDAESGISASSGCGPTALLADTAGVTLTCSATNGAGLSASASVTVKIDMTPPMISAVRSPEANGAGWNNTDVTVNFSCADGLSGVSLLSPVSALLSAGANQAVAGMCTDKAGNSANTVMGGISIDKTPPTSINVTASPNPVAVNMPVTLAASLSDSGGSGLTEADYSVNAFTPSLLSAASGAAAQVSGALPAVTATGVYNICVHARDLAGNTGSDECLFLPVYDPTGGFVTGGGWINSPAGAYSPDSSLTGKATFGFESRYQNGASVPTGDTQFQFRVANLNFKSTAYEWLVIAGARAQYKGSGTINGGGSYSFLLTAIDGDTSGGGGVDRFRIKIWTNAGVIYDNQPGSADSDDPTTALGGGSIVIHRN